jgi:hypothetical protein
MDEEQLRTVIRERVRTGQLPPVSGRIFGGRGSNTACDCCGQIIGHREIEYEVELSAAFGAPGPTFLVHAHCHWIWREESGPRSPPESAGSQNLIWNALRGAIERVG